MSSLVTPPPKLVSVALMDEVDSAPSSRDHSDPSASGEAVTNAAPNRLMDPAPSKTGETPSTQRPITSHAPRALQAMHGGSHISPYPAFSLTDSPGLRAPQNTPADHTPVAAIRPSHAAGTSALAPGNAGTGAAHRPILFNSILSRGVAHAITPGNTPSSLERITKRIAGNLLTEGQGQGQNPPTGGAIAGACGARIAPSYERRFVAGLHDLDNKFAQASRTRHRPLTPPAGTDGDGKGEAGATSPSQWPQTFAASVADVPIPTVPLAPERQD